MIVYKMNEPIFDTFGNLSGNVVKTYTREQILEEYWDYWKQRMVHKYGDGHELITEENCIDDWIVIHWAWTKEYTYNDA